MSDENSLTLISAIAAAIMAVLALIKAFNRERKVNKLVLEDIRERLESKKKACIEAKLSLEDMHGIIIYNTGECAARNIRLQIIGAEDENGLYLLIHPEMNPYPILHKGGLFRIVCAVGEDCKPVVHMNAIWDDDYAINREREIIINLL